MKYVLAKYYRNPLDINESGITFGVIVQSDNIARLRFSDNINALKAYDPNADITAFQSLEKSLKDILKSNNIIISSPSPTSENKVTPTEIEFLQEFTKSYQGKHQFSEVKEAVNYSNISTALNDIYSTSVNL